MADIRVWYNHRRAYYAAAVPLADGAVDELMLALVDEEDGGCVFEFAVRWYILGPWGTYGKHAERREAPRVEVFDDAWRVFGDEEWADFRKFLAWKNGQPLSVEEFEEALRGMGFVDKTRTER